MSLVVCISSDVPKPSTKHYSFLNNQSNLIPNWLTAFSLLANCRSLLTLVANVPDQLLRLPYYSGNSGLMSITDISCTSGRIHRVICFNHKTGMLWTIQQEHLFVAEKEKTL
jgi:hypothetical protein